MRIIAIREWVCSFRTTVISICVWDDQIRTRSRLFRTTMTSLVHCEHIIRLCKIMMAYINE